MRPPSVTRELCGPPRSDSKMRFAGQRFRLRLAFRRTPLGTGELLSAFARCPSKHARVGTPPACPRPCPSI
eukprot:4838863-Alexandrium_andersonii.AAC.1